MAVTSNHILTTGDSQRDVRHALHWAYDQPTTGNVTVWFQDGAQDATKAIYATAVWDAAKQTSLDAGG